MSTRAHEHTSTRLNHLAIICSNYEVSKKFYTEVLGLEIIREVYREERESYKLDLALNGEYIIELFSFSSPPKRLSRPEATGLRHLAFSVQNLDELVSKMNLHSIEVEKIRIDEFTNKRYTFIADPDGLPIEFCEY